jgi:hypothetical protein
VNLNKIVDEILANPSGGTVRLTGSSNPTPDTGYFVGNGRQGLVCPAGMVSRAIVLGALSHLSALPEEPRFVGWWTDGDRFYVEPSDWTANYNHAVQMASERGELAFFDVARQADIRMDQPAA